MQATNQCQETRTQNYATQDLKSSWCLRGLGGTWYPHWIMGHERTDYKTLTHLLVAKVTQSWFWALGSRFSSEGQVPCVTWDLSGRGGGLHGDGGVLVRSRGRRSFLCSIQWLGAKVGQWQGDGSHIVDSQQDFQGADLLEALIHQGLTGSLDLFYTW